MLQLFSLHLNSTCSSRLFPLNSHIKLLICYSLTHYVYQIQILINSFKFASISVKTVFSVKREVYTIKLKLLGRMIDGIPCYILWQLGWVRWVKFHIKSEIVIATWRAKLSVFVINRYCCSERKTHLFVYLAHLEPASESLWSNPSRSVRKKKRNAWLMHYSHQSVRVCLFFPVLVSVGEQGEQLT